MNINLYEILVRNFSTPVNLETESRKSKFSYLVKMENYLFITIKIIFDQ